MNKRLMQTVVCALPVLLIYANPTVAEDLSYDYLEFQYIDTEIDTSGFGDVDGDGFEFGGSFAVADNVHLFANFQSFGFDFDVDGKSVELGAGYMQPIAPAADIVARVSYIDGEIDTPFGDADDNGFALALGVRQAFGPQLEGAAYIRHINLDESSSDLSLELDGEYFFSEQFAAGLSLELGEDAVNWGIRARYYFSALN